MSRAAVPHSSSLGVRPGERDADRDRPAYSDIFIDPAADGQLSSESRLNAATLLGRLPDGDWQFSARVTAAFASTFDAGVLLLWLDESHWAKFCFEYSPDAEAESVMIGFEAQSPHAGGCHVTFDDIRFSSSRLHDLRDGS